MTEDSPLVGYDERFTALEAKLDDVHYTLTAILAKVDFVVAEVKPTLDSLMTSPLIKMLGGGKK